MKNKTKIYIIFVSCLIGFSTLFFPSSTTTAKISKNEIPQDHLTISSSPIQTEICRPSGDIRYDWGYPESNHYVNIDDDGDGTCISHAGFHESAVDIFDMHSVSYNINPEEPLTIIINLLCECFVTRLGYSRITAYYRFGDDDDWSSGKSVSSPFSMAWTSFTWNDIEILKSDMDELQIRLIANIDASGFGGWVTVDAMNAEITYTAGEKIAVLFHNEDAVSSSAINFYKSILKIFKGYTTVFSFGNSEDFHSDIVEVDLYEREFDKVFFYFGAHGCYTDGESYLALYGTKKEMDTVVSSAQVKQKLNLLETDIIGILVDACQAGKFAERFDCDNYLIMTSTDTSHSTFKWLTDSSFWFSDDFWNHLLVYDLNAVEAWTDAKDLSFERPFWWWQYPLMNDNCDYVFFED